jgi:hypothetical protein
MEKGKPNYMYTISINTRQTKPRFFSALAFLCFTALLSLLLLILQDGMLHFSSRQSSPNITVPAKESSGTHKMTIWTRKGHAETAPVVMSAQQETRAVRHPDLKPVCILAWAIGGDVD